MDSAAVMGRNTMTYQTIDLVNAAQTRMRSLSLSQQQTVIDFIEFLASKQVVESDKPQDESSRVFGLHVGMGEIHEGFEDPLPDEFWTESL
jgi:Protein of unknown function (DUF2281)